MTGLRSLGAGALILAVGFLLSVETGVVGAGGTYVVTAGAALFGVHVFRDPNARAQHRMRMGTRVIFRSMVSMTAVEGPLTAAEIALIQMVARAAFGCELPADLIVKTRDGMLADGADITGELRCLAPEVAPEDADLAIEAAAIVALSGDRLCRAGQERLAGYAEALGIGTERFQRAYAEACGFTGAFPVPAAAMGHGTRVIRFAKA